MEDQRIEEDGDGGGEEKLGRFRLADARFQDREEKGFVSPEPLRRRQEYTGGDDGDGMPEQPRQVLGECLCKISERPLFS